ncbi:rab11 family-interacting protein 5 [Camarhynchus parvulus]|uniref:rab11 family-interacting protein 5 n=1 Tax=Geospiza parvula TaxID=87175 RepID=UPI001237CA5C|nr:rab11 family-interacting protein 5 [Camarhynchus parvulus]
MALLRAAALPAEGCPAWLPTHVQVTVVRARGLRCKGGGKGKAGGSDAYTVIQLGREKYSTSVAEKSGGSPEWREECAFELPPEPGACAELVLTVMHRALVGMDRFLGQALVPLEPARQRGREPDERWHKLHSKAGKKEKERGEILVSLQFSRHSLTASMFDLSVKDKARSPFGKLKDKVTGKKKYDLESASAIIPSSMAALDMEDDLELGGKKSKLKGFFLKNKLRRSSLTQSSTSLGSDSTISSASLSLAAPVPEVPRSPSRQGSLSTERSVKELLASPRLSHERAFSDDASRAGPAEAPPSPQAGREPACRSSLCINGSHVYGEEAAAPRSPAASAPLPVPRRQDEPLGFAPLHAEPPWALGSLERAPQRDEPRFIPSPPSLALQEELKVSTKAVTLSNHLGRARMEESARLEGKPGQGAAPLGFPAEPAKDRAPEDSRKEDKKAKGGFFHHGGKGQGDRGTPVHTSAAGDERSKSSGWFGSKEPKESPQKPSLEVSPQVETSSDAPSHCAPRSPAPCPAALAASMPSSNLPPAPGDRQAGCLAPTNPFLNSLQSNPFFEELLADQVLNSPSPTHFLSSFPPGPRAAPEVAGSFYSSEDCSPSGSPRHTEPQRESPAQSVGVPVPETSPPAPGELPPADTDTEPAVPPLPSEWDDTFDAFATSRLKPERNKENFFASVAAEGMAFIDDPRASPPESPAGPPCQKGSQAFEKAAEIPAALRSWTNFSALDVGANLVSTTQEATVIEDVLSPVSAGSMARRRKSSTPMVWTAAFASGNPGDKEASTALSTENSAREEGDSGEEESCSTGTNGWMTIATESAAEPSESAGERTAPPGPFGPRPPFLGEGTFEAQSSSRATTTTTCVLPRSSFPPEPAPEAPPGSTVLAAVPFAGGRAGRAPVDIRSSVFRLQASMRLQASEGLLHFSSDIREARGAGAVGRASGPAGAAARPGGPPPKPPRRFAAAGPVGDGEDEEPGGIQRGKQEPWEESEGPGAEMGLPRSRASSEPSVPAPPSLPAPGAAAAEAGREFAASEGARAAAVDPAGGLEAGASQLGTGDTSVGEHQSEMNEAEVAERFETCTSNFSLDGLDRSGAEESWSQPRLSPQGATDSAKWETASKQELFPEELRISGVNAPSKLDLGQPSSWTALGEQEAAGHPHPQPQRSEHRQRPCQLELACQDGEGRAGEQPKPRAPPQQAEQGRTPASEEPEGRWAESSIDFKKADFWKPDRAERHTQGASALRNPFTLALSPSSPSNPFVEKPPAPVPVQAVLPEKLEQGDFSFRSPQEEPPGHGLQPTNATPLHVSQPLAFSTPFPAAATNPEPCGRPRPPGVPARRAAARPCPCPQPGEASALLVLPRETRPAEKPLGQQTTSPHPVKPLSAVQEGSSERKQQPRASLGSALSNGLERLKTVTTSSVQPLAPASQQDKTDPKVKDPGQLDQSAKYYHLTHDELIQLLLQKEGELSKKEEHIHELENYIDQLLVRIMEQSPTLLQIPLGGGQAP